MPGMPFHLEKGHALMALEDLLNGPQHHQVLAAVWEGLRDGTPLGDVFTGLTGHAKQLDEYGGQQLVTDEGGLGKFVSGAWFGQGNDDYWLDYEGSVDGIVRETLLFAMEMAGSDVDRTKPLPDDPFDRPIELYWHCGQRWFEAWITWESATSPIRILFATPPHAAGDVLASVLDAPAGQVTSVTASTVNADRDMVLVTETEHTERRSLTLTFWPTGQFLVPLPTVGSAWDGGGDVGAFSIHANSGGVRPQTFFE